MKIDLEKKLNKIILNIANNIEEKTIDNKTNLIRDYKFNSINMVQLIVEIESEFNIVFDDDDLLIENLSNYEDLLAIVNKKAKEQC